jgi:ATP-binding cassette subfamily B protein
LQKTLAKNRLISLWRLITGFRLAYITAITCLALAVASKTLTYMLLRYFVDDMLSQHHLTVPFYLIALGFVGLAMVEGSFTFLSGRFAARSSEGIILRLRNYLFDHLQHLPIAYHDQIKTGDLVQRCSSDVDALRRFFAEEAIGVGRIVLLFTINFIALLNLNVKLSLITVMFIPLVIFISVYFFRKINLAYEDHQNQEGTLSATLQENLSGVRVVKAFSRQPFEMAKFEQENYLQYLKGRRLVTMHATYWPTVELTCLFQYLLSIFTGATMVLNGEITIGTYMAFIGLAIWIIFPIQNLGRLIVQLSTGLVSYQRVAEIIKENREVVAHHELPPTNGSMMLPATNEHYPNGIYTNGYHANGSSNIINPLPFYAPTTTTLQGEVIFDNVSLSYGMDAVALHHISFVVKPGQKVALLGPTGSGKSSLVNLLPRFYDYTHGQIWLDGKPLKQYALPELRQQIGFVEQEPFLFSRTIRQNITYGVNHEMSDAEVEQAAKAAAIHDVIMSFPEGYNTLVGERGVTLSGGQKQRIAIARVLLKSPRILIFDDAVSAVDTETEQLIHAALERLQEGRTTFIIAHRIQTVMQADQILVLDKGRIVQRGNHAELVQQPGIYQQIYQLQAQLNE